MRNLYTNEIKWHKNWVKERANNYTGPNKTDFIKDNYLLINDYEEYLNKSIPNNGEIEGYVKIDTKLSIELNTISNKTRRFVFKRTN
jgi:hypothetical protein